jgi:hypothetical protein
VSGTVGRSTSDESHHDTDLPFIRTTVENARGRWRKSLTALAGEAVATFVTVDLASGERLTSSNMVRLSAAQSCSGHPRSTRRWVPVVLVAACVVVLVGCATDTDSESNSSNVAGEPTSEGASDEPEAGSQHVGTEARGSDSIEAAPSPTAGTIYVYTTGGEDSLVVFGSDGSTPRRVQLPLRPQGSIMVAPAGTPNAGTVYLRVRGGYAVMAIPPGAPNAEVIDIDMSFGFGSYVFAPAGTPNAGALYLTNDGVEEAFALSVILPDGSAWTDRPTFAENGTDIAGLAVAPGGVRDAGAVYVSTNGIVPTLWRMRPEDSALATIWSGRDLDDGLSRMVVAPSGTSNAGLVYLLHARWIGGDDLLIIDPIALTETTVDLPNSSAYGIAVGPPGAANAGTIYVFSSSNAVSAIEPGSAGARSTGLVGGAWAAFAIGPSGAPNAGVIYATDVDGNFVALEPGSDTPEIVVPDLSAVRTLISPSGGSNGGTVFALSQRASPYTISALVPGASAAEVFSVGDVQSWAVAPEGAPNTGTLYASDIDTGELLVIRPGSSRVDSIPIGGNLGAVAVSP